MIVEATPEEVRRILGAMHSVAGAGSRTPPSPADRSAIAAAYRYVFKGDGALDVADLPPTSPAELAEALRAPELAPARQDTPPRPPSPRPADLAEHAVRFLAVMALVDGRIDAAKIALVEQYAAALGTHGDYLRQLAEAAAGHLRWVAMDMMRANVRSIAGLAWNPDDPSATFLPYAGAGADPALAGRYQALGALPPASFGRAFWAHYRKNGYPFPGENKGLNEKFATPHDATHVLSGYDTSPRGEILVSTFTAAMHRQEPMSGHVLPVIFSWHLGIQLNPVAKSATGALDPEAFWLAWARGAAIATDTFAPTWDFWALVREPLPDLRRRYAIPPLAPPPGG